MNIITIQSGIFQDELSKIDGDYFVFDLDLLEVGACPICKNTLPLTRKKGDQFCRFCNTNVNKLARDSEYLIEQIEEYCER
jgi:uncharacterized protein YbaR (Trm112 family)